MCSYAVNKLGWTPSQFTDLPPNEKAFVIASIENKLEQDKKANARIRKR